MWGAWDNGEQGATLPVSPATPDDPALMDAAGKTEWRLFDWPGFNAAEVSVLQGPDDLIAKTAPESAWQRVAASSTIAPFYPLSLMPNWLDFAQQLRPARCGSE